MLSWPEGPCKLHICQTLRELRGLRASFFSLRTLARPPFLAGSAVFQEGENLARRARSSRRYRGFLAIDQSVEPGFEFNCAAPKSREIEKGPGASPYLRRAFGFGAKRYISRSDAGRS